MTKKIDLSNLQLKEIQNISERPLFLVLDDNKITKIDKLISQTQLQQLSIGRNQIIQINGLSTLINLTVLNLPSNNIISIDGIHTLSRLTWLNLSNNRIKIIEHLENNLQLKHLDLSDNHISRLSKITFLSKLKTFLLHGNDVTNLDKFGNFLPQSIEILSLAENRIHDLTEISYLSSLHNLKQLSIKENPCIFKDNKSMKFDYRPYIINWCCNLKILDGEEVGEKEKLVAEWLYTQGKGRTFKPGQHFDLVHYLVNECALTNMKNKSKLNNDLDKILKQRRQNSSHRSFTYGNDHKRSIESISDNGSRFGDTSCNIDETDLNQSASTQDDDYSVTNTSMLISESSFLPISPPNPNASSPNHQRTLSSNQVNHSQSSESSSVPVIRYSTEPPTLSRKPSNRSILDKSVDSSSALYSSFVINNNESCKEIPETIVQSQSNNNCSNIKISPDIPLAHIVRIQAWWRGIFTRSKNPVIKKYLSTRESQRTRSHILFLQRQMQLYYESYEQQRKLNATQSQAITFLIDQIREISQWKENLTKTQDMRDSSQQVISKDSFTQSYPETDMLDKQSLLEKIEDLQDQVVTLKETVWKIEHTVKRTLQGSDEKRISEASDEMSENSFSENSDLNRVMFEAEKILDGNLRDTLSCTISEDSNLIANNIEMDSDEKIPSDNLETNGNKY